MDIKVIVATHKEYNMPSNHCYLPIQVGSEGKKKIGYITDNKGENISLKNPYYCELTGLYWAWKNLDCDYLGLVHYRRHFTNKRITSFFHYKDKIQFIANEEDYEDILKDFDVIVPKKRNYYIETLYTHYAHTHYAEHLDCTREIIKILYPSYLESFDKVMNYKSGYMFNMFVMKKSLIDEYCQWVFNILFKLEEKIDITHYDSFQARLFGRVSELLFNVWLDYKKIKVYEMNYIYMEKIKWGKKVYSFLNSRFTKEKYTGSF